MEVVKTPTWMRIVQIIMGGIAIALSGLIVANPDATTWFFVTFLGIALIVIGISSVMGGFVNRSASKGKRFVDIGIGIIALIGGFFTLANPIAAVETLLWFVAIFVLIHGAGFIGSGLSTKDQSKGSRIGKIIIGGIVVALSAFLLANPGFTLVMMIIFLSISLLIQGIGSIISGAIGQTVVRKN